MGAAHLLSPRRRRAPPPQAVTAAHPSKRQNSLNNAESIDVTVESIAGNVQPLRTAFVRAICTQVGFGRLPFRGRRTGKSDIRMDNIELTVNVS